MQAGPTFLPLFLPYYAIRVMPFGPGPFTLPLILLNEAMPMSTPNVLQ
jgi:hypothetical protein